MAEAHASNSSAAAQRGRMAMGEQLKITCNLLFLSQKLPSKKRKKIKI